MIEHRYGTDYNITFRAITKNDIDILNDFDCGNSSINDFIRNKSLNSNKDITYIFFDTQNNTLVGFCSVCCSGISINESDGCKTYTTILPAVEIDFFAVDERYRSIPYDRDSKRYDTLSSVMFSYMIEYISDLTSTYIGATHICLYAVPKAVSFYKRCGFKEFEAYMYRDELPYVESCIPMYMPL